MEQPIDADVQTITAWLLGLSVQERKDIASSLAISYGTLRNWMYGLKNIPKKKIPLLLEKISNATPSKSNCDTPKSNSQLQFNGVFSASVRMTEAQWAAITEAAHLCGQDVETFLRNAGSERAERIVQQKSTVSVPDTAVDIPITFTGTGSHITKPAPQPDATQDKPSLS